MSGAEDRPAILVVEDEEAIRRGLCDVLTYEGFEARGVARGDDGLSRAREPDVALVVLDLMLPGLSGFDVCRELRDGGSEVPVLMLTARGAEEDVLRGFQCGADDYVTKPFSVSELLARVRALLRRGGAADSSPEPPFAVGSVEIVPEERLGRRGDETFELSRLELGLLRVLAGEPGRIVSRRRLLGEVWGYGNPDRVETRTVDMHVAKLRKKLGSGDAAHIETVRGEGYRYRP